MTFALKELTRLLSISRRRNGMAVAFQQIFHDPEKIFVIICNQYLHRCLL